MLSGSRDYSAGGTALPLKGSEIQSYFERNYIDSLTERELLEKMIRAADQTYTRVLAEKAEQDAKKQKSDT